MKFVYTVLFFADTLALILLTYFFMKLADTHPSQLTSYSLLAGIVFAVFFLIHLILRYMKLPPGETKNGKA